MAEHRCDFFNYRLGECGKLAAAFIREQYGRRWLCTAHAEACKENGYRVEYLTKRDK